jgi:hypothetical protein
MRASSRLRTQGQHRRAWHRLSHPDRLAVHAVKCRRRAWSLSASTVASVLVGFVVACPGTARWESSKLAASQATTRDPALQLERARVCRDVDGVLPQRRHRHDLQHRLIGPTAGSAKGGGAPGRAACLRFHVTAERSIGTTGRSRTVVDDHNLLRRLDRASRRDR